MFVLSPTHIPEKGFTSQPIDGKCKLLKIRYFAWNVKPCFLGENKKKNIIKQVNWPWERLRSSNKHVEIRKCKKKTR